MCPGTILVVGTPLSTSPTIFCHLWQSSAVLWLLLKSRPVHSLMLSSHLFFCLPLYRFPGTVPCTIFLQRPLDLITCPNHRNFLFSPLLVYLRYDRRLVEFCCTLFHLWCGLCMKCAKGGGSISFPRLWSSSVILLLASRSRKHKGGWIWWGCALVWLRIWVWCSDCSLLA